MSPSESVYDYKWVWWQVSALLQGLDLWDMSNGWRHVWNFRHWHMQNQSVRKTTNWYTHTTAIFEQHHNVFLFLRAILDHSFFEISQKNCSLFKALFTLFQQLLPLKKCKQIVIYCIEFQMRQNDSKKARLFLGNFDL